ncbi:MULTISPECIES: type 4b pilus protein PilO2 [Chromobacteriaceae]|uniref:type 4b pilus protein PilO2 n=1 Tax=Chromobacteriaceae TaxID=1499392 RepID=UPI00131A1FDA|nr:MULTISPECIES: type 4b pilus protein PilO2 [Chromobacteriaceae]
MSRLLFGNLVVEVRWEALLGLSKEADEIRELSSRRGTRQFLVLRNQLGPHVAGLADLPGNVRKTAYFALAGLLREMSDDDNILFLHTDPEDADSLIFIAIHEGKPTHDRVLSRDEALVAARQFIQEVGTGVTILGDVSEGSLVATRLLDLEHIVSALADEDKAASRFLPLPGGGRWAVALLLLMLAGMGGGAWWWTQEQERERQAGLAALQAASPDPAAIYRGQMEKAWQGLPLRHGLGYARAMQGVIQQLPLLAGGWRISRMSCQNGVCALTWLRGIGGTFETLLAQRRNVRFQDMNTAEESLDFAPPAGAAAIEAMDASQFYLKAGVRMQMLDDYGKSFSGENRLQVALDRIEPLVPVPPELKSRAGEVRPLAKGSWMLQGHLAFLDSLPGLMEKANNMTIDQLAVTIDDKNPAFSAKGTFYVR